MQRPRGTVWMKKVRKIRWNTVLIDLYNSPDRSIQQPRLGLESSGFSMWHFLKLIAFSLGTPVSFPPSSVNGSANKIKLK